MTNWGSLLLPDGTTMLESFKLFLGITDTAQDVQLERALDYAGGAMETYLDRTLAKREIVEKFVAHFGTVVLHDLPVAGPVTVTLDGDAQTDYGFYISRGGLAYLTRTGIVQDMPMDWRHFEQCDVTYTAGYDPIPSDLAYAIMVTASGYYSAEGTGQAPGGASGDVKKQTITGVGSIEYDVSGGSTAGGNLGNPWGAIPASAAQMVSKYKRMSA